MTDMIEDSDMSIGMYKQMRAVSGAHAKGVCSLDIILLYWVTLSKGHFSLKLEHESERMV